jgi:hypothetical protein
MGLINLTTNLKGLGFGKDRKGGGDSGQPYIKNDIPSNGDDLSDAFKYGTGGPDMFLRGGLLTPLQITNDLERWGKFFVDTKSPRGLLFIAQQNLLSRLAAKTEASYGIGYGTGQKAGTNNIVATGPINEGIYLPTSTLLQIAGNAFGVHLNKQGIDPTGLTGASIRTYSSLFFEQGNPIQTKKENRLYKLLQGEISTEYNNANLYQYGGGPGSILGIGKTNIRLISKEQRTGINNINFLANFSPKNNNPNNFDYRQNVIIGLPSDLTEFLNPSSLPAADLTEINPLELNYSNFIQPSVVTPNSEEKTKHVGFGQINPIILTKGASAQYNKIKPPTTLTKVFQQTEDNNEKYIDRELSNKNLPTTRDSIQNPDVYKPGTLELNNQVIDNKGTQKSVNIETNELTEGSTKFKFNSKYGDYYSSKVSENEVSPNNNDIIPFYITIIANSGENELLYFPANITTFNDGINAEWSSERFMGRGEEFYTYKGFKRSINVGFQLWPDNEEKLVTMYKQLNRLASCLTPDYSKDGFMRGNLFKLSLGNYITDLPGIIRSISFDVVNNDITWDLDSQMPMYIDIKSFEFSPIHDFLPRKNQNYFGRKIYGSANTLV